MQVIGTSTFIAVDHWKLGSTNYRILIALNSTVPLVYSMTTLILFGISNFVIFHIFNSLKKDVEKIRISKTQLAKWKHRHILACHLVNCVNDCFGWTLFLSTCFIFLSVINSTFYFFGDFDADPVEITLATMNILHLSLITFSSDYVRKEVR